MDLFSYVNDIYYIFNDDVNVRTIRNNRNRNIRNIQNQNEVKAPEPYEETILEVLFLDKIEFDDEGLARGEKLERPRRI